MVDDKVGVLLSVADERVELFVLVLQVDGEELSDGRMGVEPDQDPVFVDQANDDDGEEEQEDLG